MKDFIELKAIEKFNTIKDKSIDSFPPNFTVLFQSEFRKKDDKTIVIICELTINIKKDPTKIAAWESINTYESLGHSTEAYIINGTIDPATPLSELIEYEEGTGFFLVHRNIKNSKCCLLV